MSYDIPGEKNMSAISDAEESILTRVVVKMSQGEIFDFIKKDLDFLVPRKAQDYRCPDKDCLFRAQLENLNDTCTKCNLMIGFSRIVSAMFSKYVAPGKNNETVTKNDGGEQETDTDRYKTFEKVPLSIHALYNIEEIIGRIASATGCSEETIRNTIKYGSDHYNNTLNILIKMTDEQMRSTRYKYDKTGLTQRIAGTTGEIITLTKRLAGFTEEIMKFMKYDKEPVLPEIVAMLQNEAAFHFLKIAKGEIAWKEIERPVPEAVTVYDGGTEDNTKFIEDLKSKINEVYKMCLKDNIVSPPILYVAFFNEAIVNAPDKHDAMKNLKFIIDKALQLMDNVYNNDYEKVAETYVDIFFEYSKWVDIITDIQDKPGDMEDGTDQESQKPVLL